MKAPTPSGMFKGIVSLAVLFFAVVTASSLEPLPATARGRAFLASLLDSNLSLLPEYPGANVYWLFHDNYLAAKVLATSHPQLAKQIQNAIRREGVQKSGKIELLFGEAEQPLPFRQYQLTEVRRIGSKVIRTEVVTGQLTRGWEEYADLLLMAAIAEGDKPAAHKHWTAAMKFWDGKGFLDAATKHQKRYATYKLGLALLAANRFSQPENLPAGMLDKLLSLQGEAGGWITDYNAAGERLGLANVETTSLAILGIEAALTRTGPD
jgi:hypothetical protein